MMTSSLLSALLGGALIGVSASLLLALSGRVAGVSGIFGGALVAPRGDRAWRWAFVAGLLAAGGLWGLFDPGAFSVEGGRSGPGWLALAGLLVGVGTRLGSGCTSGHGVCGISRGSPRSLVATITFMAAGVLAVTVLSGSGR